MLFSSSLSYMEYLSKMKEVQKKLLAFINEEDDIEENFENFIILIPDHQKEDDLLVMKSIIYLISKIAKNHHRGPDFFTKITKIFLCIKDFIIRNYSNLEIFNIFKSNKIIILFLIEEKILTIDIYIYKLMTNYKALKKKYNQFFQPEIQEFIEKQEIEETNPDIWIKNLPYDFYEKRRIGENDNYICRLIQEDMLDDFISYTHQNNIQLDSEVEFSIFETNPLLIKKNPSLIEYASFFGSINIFNYLESSGVDIKPSLWIYAIYGNKPDIIQYLQFNFVLPYDETYEEVFENAIKCHHNNTALYIKSNLLDKKVESQNLENNFEKNCFAYCFHYYNFIFFPENLENEFILSYACKYDYLIIVENILKNQKSNSIKRTKKANQDESKTKNDNKKNKNLIKQIKFAAEKGNNEIVEFLLNEIIEIEGRGFEGCEKLTKLAIPYSITLIRRRAFFGCISLIKISIPNSVTSIGDFAFSGCVSLKEIAIPSSVTSIGKCAFSGCVSLNYIAIPSSVTTFGEGMFDGIKSLEIEGDISVIPNNFFLKCTELTKIIIPPYIVSIGDHSFSQCSLLTEINIPSSVTTIGDHAFDGCASLVKVSIPSSITAIGKWTFAGCSSLVEISIPDSLKSIPEGFCDGCSSLSQVNLPLSITSIGIFAFSKCTSLLEMVIPPSVKIVEWYAFMNCTSLTQVIIPSLYTMIGNFAFKGCTSLERLIIPAYYNVSHIELPSNIILLRRY